MPRKRKTSRLTEVKFSPDEVQIIEIDEDCFGLKVPFSKTFNNGARKLLGAWDKNRRLWVFPESRRAEAKALCRKVYKVSPEASESPTEAKKTPPRKGFVHIQITSTRRIVTEMEPITFRGRKLITATSRDSGASLARFTQYEEGHMFTQGSPDRWEIAVTPRTKLTVLNVPVSKAVSTDEWDVEIIMEAEE